MLTATNMEKTNAQRAEDAYKALDNFLDVIPFETFKAHEAAICEIQTLLHRYTQV